MSLRCISLVTLLFCIFVSVCAESAVQPPITPVITNGKIRYFQIIYTDLDASCASDQQGGALRIVDVARAESTLLDVGPHVYRAFRNYKTSIDLCAASSCRRVFGDVVAAACR